MFSTYIIISSRGDGLVSCFINALNHKPCEAVGGKGEEDRQDKENENVDYCAEHAYPFNDGEAYVFDKGDVASVKVMEINLQGIGKSCGDGYVNGKENAHNLDIVLGAQLIQLQRDGKHKIKNYKVVECDSVKISKRAEKVLYIPCGINYIGHQKHIERQRGKASKRRGVGDVAVLSVVEGVKGQQVEEKRAIMKRQGVKVVIAALCGVYLLHYL